MSGHQGHHFLVQFKITFVLFAPVVLGRLEQIAHLCFLLGVGTGGVQHTLAHHPGAGHAVAHAVVRRRLHAAGCHARCSARRTCGLGVHH